MTWSVQSQKIIVVIEDHLSEGVRECFLLGANSFNKVCTNHGRSSSEL